MTNEEAILIIDSLPAKSDVYNWRDVADAFGTAIKALQNAKKYEKALKMTCEKIAASVDVDCYKIECDKGGDCIRCAIEYYKRQAGID